MMLRYIIQVIIRMRKNFPAFIIQKRIPQSQGNEKFR